MKKYQQFKKGELVWCSLYPGVYEVVDVQHRDKKGMPYSDLLTIELKYSVNNRFPHLEILDEGHCEKLEVGIKQYLESLKEITSKLKEFIK